MEEVKESDIFVDLFKDQDPEFLNELFESSAKEIKKYSHLCDKIDVDAFDLREVGNWHYTQREFAMALHFYNKSLCYAEAESNSFSFILCL